MTTEIKNYGVTIANLTQTEQMCLGFVTSSIENTMNSFIDSQIQFAKGAILGGLKDYCFQHGITPAATEDERIAQAFSLGIVKPIMQQVESGSQG
jgi:hypothetical protein